MECVVGCSGMRRGRSGRGSGRFGLVFGLSFRYCGIIRAIQTTRLLYWRYCQSSASIVRSDIEVEASIVIDVIFGPIERKWELLKTMWALKTPATNDLSFHKQYYHKG